VFHSAGKSQQRGCAADRPIGTARRTWIVVLYRKKKAEESAFLILLYILALFEIPLDVLFDFFFHVISPA
jgi:hypothetical protein